MGAATFVGSVVIAVPFLFFSKSVAIIIATILGCLSIAAIAEIRTRATQEGEGTIAVFGGYDGTVSCVGVLVPALVVNLSQKSIVALAFGLAVAAALSMGTGQYIEDAFAIKRTKAYIQTALLLIFAAGAAALVGIIFNAAG